MGVLAKVPPSLHRSVSALLVTIWAHEVCAANIKVELYREPKID